MRIYHGKESGDDPKEPVYIWEHVPAVAPTEPYTTIILPPPGTQPTQDEPHTPTPLEEAEKALQEAEAKLKELEGNQ